jgi:hypothetical protein
MEIWQAYEKEKIQIEHIYRFAGGDRECVIFFSDKTKRKYSLYFDLIVDFRYAIENAFLGREANWTEPKPEKRVSIFVVENSDYLKYFECQTGGTFPADGIRHFILFDSIDTGIEVLAEGDPVLTELID